MTVRSRVWVLATAVVGSLATLALMEVESLHFAYRAFGLHVALEVTASFVAFLAAHLMYGRFREDGRLDDLALVCALAVLGCANFFLAAVPAAISNGRPERFSTWAPLLGRLVGEVTFAYAAFAPRRTLEHPRRAAAIGFSASGAALVAIAVIVGVTASHLPAGVNPTMSPSAINDPFTAGPLPLLLAQASGLFVYALAAVGFTRRAERRRDELMLWLAIGAVLAAISRWNYLMYPSLYSPWLYTGDAFRLASYTVLWLGAAREIGGYWRTRAEHAVFEERRRLARELHDGLAQELGFIATRARALEEETGGPVVRVVASAAERALDESRRAIVALTSSGDEPLEAAVAQAAEEVAGRVGARVRLELDRDVRVPSPTREALVRIVREAVSNAARHGHADAIRVELWNGDGTRLRVVDDGVGFDVDDPEASDGGFGLVSMRERARAVGGELTIESTPNVGTSVEVVLP
ncbi:MAG TPA: ATP-binding protein [Gaiellaceae bacterium]